MREPKLRDQINSIRHLLADTRKGNLEWQMTGVEDSYNALRGDDSAVVEKDAEGLVVLRFMTVDRPEWAVTLRQLGLEAEPSMEEENRDAMLSLLWQAVSSQLEEKQSDSMNRFTQGS